MAQFHYLPLEQLKAFTTDVFSGMGVPRDEAEVCADVLAAADRRGIDSHGIGRLKPIYFDRVMDFKIQQAESKIDIVKDFAATAVVDGNNGMGMVIAKRCMDMAIEKAKKFGIGMVVARNSTHYGIAAYYPMMACEQDMIGITGTNARPSIAPTWGVENMLGTNPLVFGMPSDEPFPFTNDYATSISQRGKIEQYAREGKTMPAGWVIGRDGTTKTDPVQTLEDLVAGAAALAPLGGIGEELGGHKGYGYATVVEILSAALQQGAFLKMLSGFDNKGEKSPYNLGHFFIAVNIAAFTDPADFRKTTGDILRALRNSEIAPGAEKIYTCGEKEYLHEQERIKTGVPLPEKVCQQMVEMRNKLGLKKWRFEWE